MKWLVAFAVILFVNAICIILTTMGNKSPLFLVYDIDKNDVLEFNWEDTSAPDDVRVASSAQEPRSNEVNVANEVLEMLILLAIQKLVEMVLRPMRLPTVILFCRMKMLKR